MHDTSLQVVGEAIMGYSFAADHNLKKCYENLNIRFEETKSTILLDVIIPYLPGWMISLVTYFPLKYMKQTLKQRRIVENVSGTMVNNKLEMQRLGQTAEKDLFSVLVDINSKANVNMTFQELKEQFRA
ncbi:hypothetical protein BDQ17DRAFT_235138 [Cyathus striatus]|nr:hypothetical protein BDQ17DRAFT_235138 [Cyathus striatus]